MGRARCRCSRRPWSSFLLSSTTSISLLCWTIWTNVRPIEAFRAGGPMPLAISGRRGCSSTAASRPLARLQRGGCVNGSYRWGSAANAVSIAGSSSSSPSSRYSYEFILDFAQPATIDLVDRLDDAIMGGVSTSSVQPSKDGYAIWAGVCRTDGGGFCGFRTNPFATPLRVPVHATGLYVDLRMASDDEPERRVWKMSTRTRPDRGEQLYQAPIMAFGGSRRRQSNNNNDAGVADGGFNATTSFQRCLVPFATFEMVRGPRRVANAPPLNYTAGLYQLGMTMSKFAWDNGGGGELPNFRDGVFQVHIKEIGIYYDQNGNEGTASTLATAAAATTTATTTAATAKPGILSKNASRRKRPLVLKVLTPVATVLFFSEASQRRKSAYRLLQKRWKLSRLASWRWSLRRRMHVHGLVKGLCDWGGIFLQDAARFVLGTALRIAFFYPIVAGLKLVRVVFPPKKPGKQNSLTSL